MAFRIGGIVAAFFVLIGSFLPWATVSAFGMSESVGGMESDADFKIPGLVFLLLALVVGGLFGVWKRVTVIAAGGVSVLVLLLTFIEFFDIKEGLDELEGFGDSSYGIGLFLILLGALAGIALAAVGQAQLAKPGAAGQAGAAPWGQQQPWGQQPQGATPWGQQQQAPASLPVQPQQQQYAQQPQQPFAQPQQQAQQAQPFAQQPPAQAAPAQPAQAAPAAQPAPSAAPAANAPAGWLADPYGQAQLRYWDGTRWTEHTHNHPTA